MPQPTLIVNNTTPFLEADGQTLNLDFSEAVVADGPPDDPHFELQATGRYLAISSHGGHMTIPTRYVIHLRSQVWTTDINVSISHAEDGVGSMRSAADDTPVAFIESVPVVNNSAIIDDHLPTFSDRYADVDDFVLAYGTKTSIEWSNLNPNQTTIDSARLQAALADAQDEVDRRLANSVYAVPLTNLSTSDARFIKDLAVKLALCWLYDHRPGVGVDKEGKQTQAVTIRKDVDRRITNVYTGNVILSADRRILGLTPAQ